MLNDLTAWGKTCGLKFNPEKSVAVIFSRRRKQPPFSLTIDGREIEFKTEVKYLGVTLDSKLHWNKHIDDKLSKTKRYLHKIAYMTRKNWGPKPRLMRWAYLGVVRPMLCYGAMIWGHRAPELMEKFRRINRMAINTFASFPKSTPTAALEIMLDILPLHLFCTQEALAARIRLDGVLAFGWDGMSHTKNHARSHMRFWKDKLEEYGIHPGCSDRTHTLQWNTGFKINRDSFDGHSKHRQPAQYNAFTDGSRINEQTGSGLVIYKGKQEIQNKWFRLPDYSTVFQAEVAAIAEAAKTLSELGDDTMKYVKIFVDSQAAIQAVGNPTVNSKLVAEAIGWLNKLAATTTAVSIVWIPAHKGYAGNERADELAKKGANETVPSLTISVGRPQAAVKTQIKESVYKEWEVEWQNMKIANHARSFYAGPNPGKAKYVFKLARLELGHFIRIITGHNNLNFFQNKIGLDEQSECRFCEEGPETITHFLRSCPRFEASRRDVLLDTLPTPEMKWSVRSLIDFSYVPGLNEAMEGAWDPGGPSPNTTGGSEDCSD